MQMPIDWYVYVVPGFLYLTLLYLIFPQELANVIQDHSAIGVAVVIVASYLLGVLSNHVIIKIVRPIFQVIIKIIRSIFKCFREMPPVHYMSIENHIQLKKVEPILAQLHKDAYQSMLFSRSILVPLFFLTILGICKVWKLAMGKLEGIHPCVVKVIISILLLGVSFIFVWRWWEKRKTHNKIITLVDKELKMRSP